MPKLGTYGSVRGVPGNRHPYRDQGGSNFNRRRQPRAQGGGIDPFTAQQRTNLAGLGAPVHSLKNTAFGGVGKTAPTCVRHDLGSKGRRYRRRRRFSRIFTRPTGSLRCD